MRPFSFSLQPTRQLSRQHPDCVAGRCTWPADTSSCALTTRREQGLLTSSTLVCTGCGPQLSPKSEMTAFAGQGRTPLSLPLPVDDHKRAY